VGNPTNTKVLGHDEKIKVRPSGIVQKEEIQIKES